MMDTPDRLTGFWLCGAVGAFIGLAAGLVVATLNVDIGVNAPLAFAGAAALVGAAGGAGYGSTQIGRVHKWGGAALILSLVCGSLVAFTQQAAPGAPVLTGVAPAILGFGLLGWALLAGRTTTLTQAVRRLPPSVVAVPLGAVSGGAFGLGYGLFYALTYTPLNTPPCQSFAYCIPFGPWQGFISMVPAASIGGAALGVTLVLAFGLCAWVRPAGPERS